MKNYDIKKNDIIIICNAYGVNSATIDTALYMNEKKVVTIALTSSQISEKIPKDHPSRHPSALNLCDISDYVIDIPVPYGDVTLNISNSDIQMGPVSTIQMIFCLHWLSAQTAKTLLNKGIRPSVWKSLNMEGGDDFNSSIMEKYKDLVRHL